MATTSCTCADATVCPELPPVASGSKLVVLNDANCMRTLAPPPGSVLYADGSGVTWADGGASLPLALPSLVNFEQPVTTSIPSILSKFNGGVIASVTPDASADGLILQSLAGEWVLAAPSAQLCFDPDDIITECCCPSSFAVWVTVGEETCLRSFNPCEDATNVESGSIFSCEDGCIRKLVGTSGDQVPAWDVATQTWIPTEISDLIPTPDSVLDVAAFSISSGLVSGAPALGSPFNYYYGTQGSWAITQSGTIINATASAAPYAHSVIRIINAGWHEISVTFEGELYGTTTALDPDAYVWLPTVSLSPIPTVIANPKGVVTIVSSFADPTYTWRMLYSVTANVAANFSANALIEMNLTITGFSPSGSGGSLTTTAEFTHRARGTVTRIT